MASVTLIHPNSAHAFTVDANNRTMKVSTARHDTLGTTQGPDAAAIWLGHGFRPK